MQLLVEYKDGFWCFQVIVNPEDDASCESSDTDDYDEAIEEVTRLLELLRDTEDPLAGLFDED